MNKRSIINDIKVLKESQKSLKDFAKEKYIDENGNAVIDVFITKDQLFNPLSDPNNPEIDDSIYTYIESKANLIPVEYPIVIKIHSNSDVDVNYISKELKNHYETMMISKNDELRRNRIASIVLFIIGLVLMALYLTLELIPRINVVFNEVFGVIASFIIWESADFAIINRGAIRIEFLKIAHLALSKFEINK